MRQHWIGRVCGTLGLALLALQPAASATVAPSPRDHSIPRVHRDPPPEAVFAIQGWVLMTSACAPCPAGESPWVIVSARNAPLESSDRLTSRELRLRAQTVAGLQPGEHYRFVLRSSGSGAFELIEVQPAPVRKPVLVPVDDPAVIASVQTRVQQRLGSDFSLDHLPADPTLHSAFTHLLSESSSDIVTGALEGVPAVYAVDFAAREDGDPVRVFAFATRPDFHGELVYAVSRAGAPWSVFVTRP